MKIIGLSGKKRAGKDTVYKVAADILADQKKNTRVGRVGFADAVKHEVSEITGFRMDFIEKHKDDFRSLLQVWGTDFRRKFFGSDYWVEQMDEVIRSSEDHYDFLFITDVRFDNEAEFITQQGGVIVKVERRNTVFSNIQDAVEDPHISENAMNSYSNYNYILNNDGTEKELYDSVKAMLGTINILENAA